MTLSYNWGTRSENGDGLMEMEMEMGGGREWTC